MISGAGNFPAAFQSTSSVWRTTIAIASDTGPQAFQSTSSVWRTTAVAAALPIAANISIHVLRVEDDVWADTG